MVFDKYKNKIACPFKTDDFSFAIRKTKAADSKNRNQTNPWAIMASATLTNPPMLAPIT